MKMTEARRGPQNNNNIVLGVVNDHTPPHFPHKALFYQNEKKEQKEKEN